MKISTNTLVKSYGSLPIHTKEHFTETASLTKDHNFDVLTIQSNRREIEERTFAEAVSKELISDLKQISSEEKLQNLQNQIALGTYQIDTQAIASKILLV